MKNLHWDLDLLPNREKICYKSRFGELGLRFQKDSTGQFCQLQGDVEFSIKGFGLVDFSFEQTWDCLAQSFHYKETDRRRDRSHQWRISPEKNSSQVTIETDSRVFSTHEAYTEIFSPLQLFFWMASGQMPSESDSIFSNVLSKKKIELVEIRKVFQNDGTYFLRLRFPDGSQMILKQIKFWIDPETNRMVRLQLGSVPGSFCVSQ